MSLLHIEDKYFEYPELVEKLRNEFFNMVATLDVAGQKAIWDTFKVSLDKEYEKLKKKKKLTKPKKATATIQFYFPNENAQTESITIDETKLGQMRHPERFTASIDKLKSLEGKMIELDSADFETLSTLLTREKATGILNIIDNIRSKLRFIRITNVNEIAPRGSARTLAEIPLGFGRMMSNRYIETIMTVSDDGLLQFEQSIPSDRPTKDCLATAVIKTFKESYDSTHKKKRLSLQSFQNAGKELSIKQIEPFFKQNRLCLTAYNRKNEVVYAYDPTDEGRSRNSRITPAHCYLAIHNKHAHLLDKNIASLSHKKPEQSLITKPSTDYPSVSIDPERCILINDISGLIAFFAETQSISGETFRIHYNNDIEQLFFHMCDAYNYEADIYINREVISGLTFHLQNTYILSDFPIELGDEGRPLQIQPQEYKSFVGWLHRITTTFFQNPTYKSHYSKNLQIAWTELSKAQLHKHFNIPNDGCSETIDIVRAYTKNLCDIPFIPVFNPLDDFQTYKIGTPIDTNSFYTIRNKTGTLESWFIGNRTYSIVSGFVLAESGLQDEFEICSVITPSQLEVNPFPTIVSELYSDKKLPTSSKKFILNMVIGLMNKRYAHCERALYTTDIDEASIFSESVSAIRDKEYLSIQKSERVPLQNGFMPVGFLVYDLMRLRMLQLYRQLKVSGATVYGIATDCFFVDKIPTELPLTITKTFADLGKFHVDGLKLIPRTAWSIEQNENPIQLPRRKHIRITVLRENTLVSGFLPGCGKTHLLATTLPKGETLFLTSTNEQEERITVEYGHTAMTLCKFLGLRLQDNELVPTQNGIAINTMIRNIVIDEVYQQNLVLLAKFRTFQWQNSHLNYYASGDPYQTNVPNPWNNAKHDYSILADMFPNELRMKGCKRFANSKDIETLEQVWTDLFKNRMDLKPIVDKYGFKTIASLRDLKESGIQKCLTLRNATTQTLNRVYTSDWGYSKSIVIPKVYCKGLTVNRKYTVESESQSHYTILGKEYPKYLFRFPYASTAHSSQGSTIDSSYAIFDMDCSAATKEWFWVAITRATKLENVYIYTGQPLVGTLENEASLKKQNYCCLECGEIVINRPEHHLPQCSMFLQHQD